MPSNLKTLEMCRDAVLKDIWYLRYIPDWFIKSLMKIYPNIQYSTLYQLYERRQKLKTAIHRELLPVTWHPDRVVDWCFDEDEKKDLEKLWR